MFIRYKLFPSLIPNRTFVYLPSEDSEEYSENQRVEIFGRRPDFLFIRHDTMQGQSPVPL